MADINDKLKRAIDGPAPQHKLPGRDVFEPSEGSDGALHTKVTDVEGNTIDPRDVKLPSDYPDSATLAELQAIKEENTEIKKTQGKIIEALQANNENLMNTNQVLESVIKDNRIQSDAQVTGSKAEYDLPVNDQKVLTKMN